MPHRRFDELGYAGGWVEFVEAAANGCIWPGGLEDVLHIRIDGERGTEIRSRSVGVYEAPGRTTLRVGDLVRSALEGPTSEPAPASTSPTARRRAHSAHPVARQRWYYGRVTRVHRAGEIVDIKFESGEESLCVPIFDVRLVALQA